jgi:hypothetical protein
MEGINHGRTRTELANALSELELRKRKSRASVLVCGLECLAFAHELREIAVDDAVALLDWIATWLAGRGRY